METQLALNRIVIDGLNISYYRSENSDNTPADKHIVLLHGWTPNGISGWAAVINGLETKGYAVLAPDMPGFGQSDEPDSIWRAQEYAQWLREFVEKLSIETCSLV